jgi:hypothetical protein
MYQQLLNMFPDMINDSDLDGNKVLDFEEFLVMMEKKVNSVAVVTYLIFQLISCLYISYDFLLKKDRSKDNRDYVIDNKWQNFNIISCMADILSQSVQKM